MLLAFDAEDEGAASIHSCQTALSNSLAKLFAMLRGPDTQAFSKALYEIETAEDEDRVRACVLLVGS